MTQQRTDALSNLRNANRSLKNALSVLPRSDIIISAIIKNFEFNYELSWKALKRMLNFHGIQTHTPRQTIAESFRKNFIAEEEIWLKMLSDRNLTVHTYDEVFAREMSDRIADKYMPLFNALIATLEKELNEEISN